MKSNGGRAETNDLAKCLESRDWNELDQCVSDDEWRDITVMERVLWQRYRDGVGLQSLLRVHVNILEPRKIRTSNTTLERFKRKEQVKTVLKMETFFIYKQS